MFEIPEPQDKNITNINANILLQLKNLRVSQ